MRVPALGATVLMDGCQHRTKGGEPLGEGQPAMTQGPGVLGGCRLLMQPSEVGRSLEWEGPLAQKILLLSDMSL